MTELLSITQWNDDFSVIEYLSDGIDTLLNQSTIPTWVTIIHMRQRNEHLDLPGDVEIMNNFRTDQVLDYLKEHAQKGGFLYAATAGYRALQIRFTITNGYETLFVIPTENLLDLIRKSPQLIDPFVTCHSQDVAKNCRYLHDLAMYDSLYKLACSPQKTPLKIVAATLVQIIREQDPMAFKKFSYIDPKQYPVNKRQEIVRQAALRLRKHTTLTENNLYKNLNQLLPPIPRSYLESMELLDKRKG